MAGAKGRVSCSQVLCTAELSELTEKAPLGLLQARRDGGARSGTVRSQLRRGLDASRPRCNSGVPGQHVHIACDGHGSAMGFLEAMAHGLDALGPGSYLGSREGMENAIGAW